MLVNILIFELRYNIYVLAHNYITYFRIYLIYNIRFIIFSGLLEILYIKDDENI